MNKNVLRIVIILLFSIFAISFILNVSYAKYYIVENLQAINIKIQLENENKSYENIQLVL